MKRILLAFLLVLFFAAPVIAQETVTFVWEDNPPEDFKEWRLYQSDTATFDCQNAGDPVAVIEYTGQTDYSTEYQITGTEGQRFYYQLTGADLANNESDCSNEVTYALPNLPPGAPFNLTVDVVVQ